MPQITAMEVPQDAVLENMPTMQQSSAKPKKSTKKRRKKKKLEKVQSIVFHEENIEGLQERLMNPNLKALFKIKKEEKDIELYLEKLHILANCFVYMEDIIKKLRNMQYLAGIAFKNAFPARCFFNGSIFVDNTQNSLQKEDKEVLVEDQCAVVSTSEGKSAFLQVESIIEQEKSAAELLEVYGVSFLPSLLHSDNKEVVLAGKHLKNLLHQRLLSRHSYEDLYEQLPTFQCMVNNHDTISWKNANVVIQEQDLKNIQDNKMGQIVKTWLEKNGLLEEALFLIPHFFGIFEVYNQAINFLGIVSPDKKNTRIFTKEGLKGFVDDFNKMFAKLSVYKDLYALLYDQIRKEQVVYGRLLPKEKRLEFLDRNKISFLTYGPAQTLPEHLFIKTKKIAKKDQDDSFLPVMQQGMQKNQRKKEKAKTHKRPHKKPQAQYSEDSSQRILKQPIIKMQRLNCAMAHLPEYDSRVLRWVDQEWVARENPNKQSLLYHTCGFPYLDHFLYSWGKKEDQPNRKKPQILDTIYKMGGEIFFPSGLKKTVLFHFVLYARGKTQKVSKCYHRGFDDREKVHCSDFFQFKIQEDEDDQEVEPSYDVKKLEILNKVSNVDEIEFEENQFNIKFYDEYNKVGIVLFKQLQKQLTY